MRQIVTLLFILSVLSGTGCGREEMSVAGFHEPADPDSLLFSDTWDSCSPGLHVSFADDNIRYSRSAVPDTGLVSIWEAAGWKGERVHTQVILWSTGDVAPVILSSTSLSDALGNTIDSLRITLSPVGYVLTDAFLDGCGRRNKDTIPAHLAGDILHHNRPFMLPGRTARPVWLSVDIPEDAHAGDYTGKILVTVQEDTLVLPYRLRVQNMALPPPSGWSFHLDLWQNPFAIARIHDVPLWSQEHWQLISNYLEMLAGAGQKCITTSIIDHPWHGQTFDPFLPMITWIHNTTGKWDYDYSIFDQYVETAIDAGISGQINCYTMVTWGNRFSWFEEDSAGYITRELEPGSMEYKKLWRPFLWDFREHLRVRRWLEKTTIAMDERNHDQMAAQLAFLKETAPEFRVTLAGHNYSDLMPSIYDFSFNWRLIGNADREMLATRHKKGQKTTFYVACGIPRPNTFTFSPPFEATAPGWIAAAFGFDGFLRWAYNSWPEDPLRDSRFIKWPAGDTYLVYPGPLSSVRFEKLREGIQDYEKIRIIRKRMETEEGNIETEAWKELKMILSELQSDPGTGLKSKIEHGKKLINRLSNHTDQVQVADVHF